MNKKYFYVCALLMLSNLGFSQEQEVSVMKNKPELVKREKSEKDLRNDLLAELDGTFQFRIANKEKSVLINSELLNRIKSSREFVNPVYFFLEDDIQVYIPSKSEIQSANFQKLERVIYQSIK